MELLGEEERDTKVVIERFCNRAIDNEPPLSPPTRKLQQTSWQVEYYVVVSNVLCGSLGCTSSEDINAINALLSSISTTLQTNVRNGNFVSQLIQNQALQGIDINILGCLSAWGSVIQLPQGTVSQNVPNQFQFYPVSTCFEIFREL